MAESLALRDGILLASSLNLERVVLESDNLEVVQACRKEIQRGEIRAIVEDISQIKQNFVECGFTWTDRQGNGLAHHVAAMAKENLLPPNWTYNITNSVNVILQKDKANIRRSTGDAFPTYFRLEAPSLGLG